MAWVSELEGSELQTMFISQIYATERVQAGNDILANYGPSYCEQFVTWNCINDLTNELKPPIVIGELSTVMFSLASASVPRIVRGENLSTHLVARIDSPTIQRIRDIMCSTDTGASCARQETHRAERHSRGRDSPASMVTRRRREPDRPRFAKWLGRRSCKRDATASGLLSTNPICGRGLSRPSSKIRYRANESHFSSHGWSRLSIRASAGSAGTRLDTAVSRAMWCKKSVCSTEWTCSNGRGSSCHERRTGHIGP